MKKMRLCAAVAAWAALALVSGCGSSVPIIISPPPAPAPVPLPPPPPEPPPPAAEVFAIAMPGAAAQPTRAPDTDQLRTENATGYRPADDATSPSGAPVRMGLILPLRSETLGAAAEALRAGFMAAWERDRDNITVTLVETGDVAQDILSSYAQTLEGVDLVVGPLARSAVTAVATSALVTKPTIALNHPEGFGTANATPLPQQCWPWACRSRKKRARWRNGRPPNSPAPAP